MKYFIFFQATEYDVVIIEDLDRFGTSKVFLKLRELNFLLNESKVIERHIVFLYAVKDDIFKDEERTKFFDYISTVIPIINPYNSKAILKKALEERGGLNEDISDDDLSEMAFFIQDMRILKNIANEYAQYHNLLCKNNKHLDRAKLLAMIVYKNYCPHDFALLHRRQGKVYECLSKKPYFIKLALENVECKKRELTKLRQLREDNLYLQEDDLRTLFLDKLRYLLSDQRLSYFSVSL